MYRGQCVIVMHRWTVFTFLDHLLEIDCLIVWFRTSSTNTAMLWLKTEFVNHAIAVADSCTMFF